MTYYVNVNRGRIDSNRKNKTNLPPISIRRGKRGASTYAHEVELPEGTRLIYSPHEPILPCGARLVAVASTIPKIIR